MRKVTAGDGGRPEDWLSQLQRKGADLSNGNVAHTPPLVTCNYPIESDQSNAPTVTLTVCRQQTLLLAFQVDAAPNYSGVANYLLVTANNSTSYERCQE